MQHIYVYISFSPFSKHGDKCDEYIYMYVCVYIHIYLYQAVKLCFRIELLVDRIMSM